MSASSFYTQQTKHLHARYKLSANAVHLLKTFDNFKIGCIDEATFARLVRWSPSMRKAAIEIISKCAKEMQQDPKETNDCIALIHQCTEILEMAEKGPATNGFSFMKCPREIREKIYEEYIHRGLTSNFDLFPLAKRSLCICSNPEVPAILHRKFNMSLGCVSKAIREEFYTYLYGRQMFHFSCACDMHKYLSTNQLFRHSIRSIKVHWSGPASDKGFKVLATCPRLHKLHIIISKFTTFHLTPRQVDMNRYFVPQRPARLFDALGIDELLHLRGMVEVKVSHILAKQGSRRSDEERAGLQALLSDKLLLPRNY